jgi:hypothetical protein
MPSTRTARLYLLLQGGAVLGWWAVLLLWPASRALFLVHGAPEITLSAFAAGDLAIVGAGSLAVGASRDRAWAAPLAWIVAGAMTYAALYTILTALVGATGPLGALLMTPAAAASLVSAMVLQAAARPPAA